jgi:ribose 5-phosphate isomerase B
MKIALATDHAGFNALHQLKQYLQTLGHEYVDYGPENLDPDDDYPDFIFKAARAVAAGECDCGIIFGGSGQGEAIAANRVKGIRCAVFYGPITTTNPIDAEGTISDDPYEILKLSRQHNHANMLSLSGRFLDQGQIEHAVKTWLETPYSDAERHLRRIRKLDEMM